MRLFKLLIGFSFFSVSFLFNDENSKKEFKTFDEYKLEGVPFTGENVDLYVLVDEQKDSIKVQISSDLYNPIYYINKKKYWYSLTSKLLESSDSAVEYNEKYIYNDTIINYNYFTHKYGQTVELGSDLILVKTKDRILYLSYDMEITKMILEKDDVDYRFKILKELVVNYKDIFIPIKYPIIVYPIRYYNSYKKVIKKDTLFLYDEESLNNSVCLKKAQLLNSLGEFDTKGGVSIINEIETNNSCK